MGRRRLYKNFAWRFDSAYWADRKNDKVVFNKILRDLRTAERRGQKPPIVTLIRRLSKNELWATRLAGKTPESWKRCFNRWRLRLKAGQSSSEKLRTRAPFSLVQTLPPENLPQNDVTLSPSVRARVVEAEGLTSGEDAASPLFPDSPADTEKQQMTPANVLLIAAIGVAVGFLGGFDLGYTLGHDAGKRGAE